MSELYIHLIFFCLVLAAFILGWVCVFAWSHPHDFIRWTVSIDWITKRVFSKSKAKWDKRISYGMGSVSLILLLLLAFVVGGWFTTVIFNLWSSPFVRFFFRYQ